MSLQRQNLRKGTRILVILFVADEIDLFAYFKKLIYLRLY